MALLDTKFPSLCKQDRQAGTVQCVTGMTIVYRSSGKAINSKIHKYSLYHTVRQDPKPIPGQIMDQMFTEKKQQGQDNPSQ